MSRWTFSRKLSHTESQLIHARCWIAKETLNNWAHYTKNINSNKLGLTNVNVRFPHRGITTKTANSSAFESNPWNFSRAMTNDNDTRRKKRVCNKEANSRIFWQSKALKPVDEMGHNAHITWYHRLHALFTEASMTTRNNHAYSDSHKKSCHRDRVARRRFLRHQNAKQNRCNVIFHMTGLYITEHYLLNRLLVQKIKDRSTHWLRLSPSKKLENG